MTEISVKRIRAPLTEETVKSLKAGDQVLLSGTIYTARDMVHEKLVNMLKNRQKLPFSIKGSVIYYTGPSPAPPGKIIGSAGPTTSYRMDPFVLPLLEEGLKGMIGKGPRSHGVTEAIKTYCAVYFGATGGAAALISKSITESEVIAFKELGTEALRRLRVKDMPLIVINDCYGNDLYRQRQHFAASAG